MASAIDIIKAVNPPRAAFLDFPLGHTTGKPHEPELQREILLQALDAFRTMTEPGSIKTLPFRWSDEDEWKKTAMMDGDSRVPRHYTRQCQPGADRLPAETNSSESRPASQASA